MSATKCPAHLILLDFITRTILGEQYRSLSSSLCNFLHSPVTPSLLGPNIPLNTLFSKLHLYCYLFTQYLRITHNINNYFFLRKNGNKVCEGKASINKHICIIYKKIRSSHNIILKSTVMVSNTLPGQKKKNVSIHDMKAYRRNRGIALLILRLATRIGECKLHTPAALSLGKKSRVSTE